MWQTRNNQIVEFSTRQAWYNLREEWPEVKWRKVIWFNQCIPRHAFMLWLAVQGKLLTKDKLAIWNKNAELECVFCKSTADSHEHLFFQCEFVKDVWKELKQYMNHVQEVESLQDMIRVMSREKEMNRLAAVVNKLIVAAAVYYIWQERNGRIFKNQQKNRDAICQTIRDIVRYKLMNIKVRMTRNVERIAALWELKWFGNYLKAK
uniref:uncharacterized protein LOC122588377 n=1 Tax=Erigeron canadensis TaxID=72917 RepID=UPI001CB97322|nr:uncharacterized protein LOC122588377 [Erigeron canadensis]